MLYHCDVRLSDQELETLIADDIPVFDLTSHLLGIADQPGSIAYITREETVICASEEAARILVMLASPPTPWRPAGSVWRQACPS